MFDVFAISGSGLTVSRTWMDAISHNLANINTVRPTSESAFQARYVMAQETDTTGTGGGGPAVTGIAAGDPTGRLVYSPGHPLADANGMVRYPDIDMGDQMTSLILAQRGYQANLAVMERARDTYEATLAFGRS